jgi:phage terminase Nu1 subunit (DNA packaging protein)
MTSLPKSVTAGELARLWGCGDRMVRQLAEKGVVVRCDRGRYDLEQSTRNYIGVSSSRLARPAAAARRPCWGTAASGAMATVG